MQDSDARRELLALVRGHRLTEIVTTAARLGIPDVIAAGAHDVDSIAKATGTHPPTLRRLLGTLAAAGVLREREDRTFDLTPLGMAMQSDVPGSLAPWISLLDRAYVREAWGQLEHAIRTGENAFAALHGEDVWAWRRSRPDEAAIFDKAMRAQSAGVGQAVADAFDFGRSRLVADIAGGTGALLAGVLRAHPHLRGILFDQPEVLSGALEVGEPDLAPRTDVVAGNFFEGVPAGADVYLLKAILHDWEDTAAIAILRTVRSAISGDGSLLVVERVLGAPNEDLEGRLSDLHMLVMPGGRERTRDEWAGLLSAGGFQLDDVRPLLMAWQLVVASPARHP